MESGLLTPESVPSASFQSPLPQELGAALNVLINHQSCREDWPWLYYQCGAGIPSEGVAVGVGAQQGHAPPT